MEKQQGKKPVRKTQEEAKKKNAVNMPKKQEPEKELEVSAAEMGEYLGVTERRVRQLKDEGIVISEKRGKYLLKKSVRAYIENMKARDDEQTKDLAEIKLKTEQEKWKHEQAKRRKTEIQVDILQRKVHYASDVELFWNAMCVNIKNRLKALPTRAAPLLLEMEDKQEIKSILQGEVESALNELAEYDLSMFDSKEKNDEASAGENE